VSGYDPIVFDLDGTVVDTVELIRMSFRHAVRQVLGADLPDDVIMAGVGQPLMTQMVALSAEHAQELYDTYREYNHRVHDDLIREYDGIEAALGRLRAAGRRLAIVTSKSADVTAMAFRSFPTLRPFFDVILTASDTTEHKPSPAPITLALERLGATAGGAVYIGDAPVDIVAGRAAGVATAAVLWGLFSREALVAARPDHVLAKPDEIVALCLEGVAA
jgi:pyrophosphatase PpaX